YLGAPGDPERGGLPLGEYQRRQAQHRIAEISALGDIPYFIERAKALYGYDNFIADTGGSLIEVIDVDASADPVIKTLTEHTVLLHIKGTKTDADRLVERFKACPKPMYYRPGLLEKKWAEYKTLHEIARDEEIDPSRFAVFGYEAILADRMPRYQALADRHGYSVTASDVATVRDGTDFIALMRKAIAQRPAD
ncbi:MAG: ATPase, partial [Alphaproteobacteria bacterium]|nr:ATPase [Alphaproteobacteria bacterium]